MKCWGGMANFSSSVSSVPDPGTAQKAAIAPTLGGLAEHLGLTLGALELVPHPDEPGGVDDICGAFMRMGISLVELLEVRGAIGCILRHGLAQRRRVRLSRHSSGESVNRDARLAKPQVGRVGLHPSSVP